MVATTAPGQAKLVGPTKTNILSIVPSPLQHQLFVNFYTNKVTQVMLVTTTGYLYLTIDVAPFYLQQKNLTLLVDSTTYHHVTADDNGSGLPIPTVHLSNLALKSVLCVSSVQRNEIFVLSFSNHAPIGNFPSSFAVKDLSTVEEVLQDKK